MGRGRQAGCGPGWGEGDKPVVDQGRGEGDKPVVDQGWGEGDKPVVDQGRGEGDKPVVDQGGERVTSRFLNSGGERVTSQRRHARSLTTWQSRADSTIGVQGIRRCHSRDQHYLLDGEVARHDIRDLHGDGVVMSGRALSPRQSRNDEGRG